MSTGIGETSTAKRKSTGNGRAQNMEGGIEITKTLAPPMKTEDLLVSFMTLDGAQLRAVFERSIAAHEDRVRSEHQRFESANRDLTDRIYRNNAEIVDLQNKIGVLKSKIEDLQDCSGREQANHAANLTALGKERDLIENMRTLFKSKLEGSQS